ncbi:HNH endonuclease [Brevibacillus brevis]|uniref:HNH endonuclease n=1 Tax=Brevibacillus brevis TaxID=1393 RepID=UPI0007D8BB83|nr:HNH endonuclease [Brevibacillus brevis]
MIKNKYKITDQHAIIYLRNGKYFIMDNSDFTRFKEGKFILFNNRVHIILSDGSKVNVARHILGLRAKMKKIVYLNGDFLDLSRTNLNTSKNAFLLEESVCKIVISNDLVGEVDIEDYEKVKPHTWQISRNGYVYTKLEGKIKYLHRYLLKVNGDEIVDHINMNKLDNKKSNLRLCSIMQNSFNTGKPKSSLREFTSIYKGLKKVSNGWNVRIGINGTVYHLGVYENDIAAANAYNYYASLFHPDFARLNDVELCENWYDYKKYSGVSMYRGACYNKKIDRWYASIYLNDRPTLIGYFDSEKECAKAYNERAIELGFDFHKLNVIDGVIYGTNEQYFSDFINSNKKVVRLVGQNCTNRKNAKR